MPEKLAQKYSGQSEFFWIMMNISQYHKEYQMSRPHIMCPILLKGY